MLNYLHLNGHFLGHPVDPLQTDQNIPLPCLFSTNECDVEFVEIKVEMLSL